MRRVGTSSEPEDPVYTVTEITGRIRRLLESHWSAVWVEGELSNVKRHPSGHVYFTLKDDKAALRGVMFRAKAGLLRFDPEDGQKVRAFGTITVYEPQGNYQINAARLEPLGVGELEIAFRQLYERLAAEGLFAAEHKRPLPSHPRTVGIVTSGSGAAIRDLISVIGRRAPHVHLVVRPARVQGEGAAEDVARGIRELDAWGGADLLIVGRGGGSLEDLWAFNEEVVARAIFACRTPVISAVGHEVDVTIADYVADLRAPTPSAAGELAVPERSALLAELAGLGEGLSRGITRFLRERAERVKLLGASPSFRDPMVFYRRRSQDVDRLAERLDGAGHRMVDRSRLVLQGKAGRLEALSPLGILGRGYAIARDEAGRIVRRATDVAVGDRLGVRVGEGELGCRVEEVRGAPEQAPAERGGA